MEEGGGDESDCIVFNDAPELLSLGVAVSTETGFRIHNRSRKY